MKVISVLTKFKQKQILHNTLTIVMLDMLSEAETGNTGEQPVRNNSANVNNRGLVIANLQIYIIHIIMPKKTQSYFFFCLNPLYTRSGYYLIIIGEL
jgi:hypothetical protein